jgi:hypothetical protein
MTETLVFDFVHGEILVEDADGHRRVVTEDLVLTAVEAPGADSSS